MFFPGPQPSEAPGVGPFLIYEMPFTMTIYVKKQMERADFWEKKHLCQECPGSEHIGWIFPNHFPTILYIYFNGFIYKSIYFNEFCIKFIKNNIMDLLLPTHL